MWRFETGAGNLEYRLYPPERHGKVTGKVLPCRAAVIILSHQREFLGEPMRAEIRFPMTA